LTVDTNNNGDPLFPDPQMNAHLLINKIEAKPVPLWQYAEEE
jgi:hypothetical protein